MLAEMVAMNVVAIPMMLAMNWMTYGGLSWIIERPAGGLMAILLMEFLFWIFAAVWVAPEEPDL